MSAPAQLQPHKSGDYWDGFSVAIEVDGTPLDLTGATVLIQFKRYPTDAVAALALATDGGSPDIVINEDPETGAFVVSPKVVTLPPAKYFGDCQVTIGGNPITYFSLVWPITQDVSR